MDRLVQLSSLLQPSTCSSSLPPPPPPRPQEKLSWFKWNGWGYKDTEFVLDKDGLVVITGNRYSLCGKRLVNFRKWAEEFIGLDINNVSPAQESIEAPPPNINSLFLEELKASQKDFCEIISFDDSERVHHSHGHTLQEVFALRNGRFKRIVDVVIYVNCHEQVKLYINS